MNIRNIFKKTSATLLIYNLFILLSLKKPKRWKFLVVPSCTEDHTMEFAQSKIHLAVQSA